MKININLNIEKSHFFVIVGALILLTGVIIVGADYTSFGHEPEDINLADTPLNTIPVSAVNFVGGIDENLDVQGTLGVTGTTTLSGDLCVGGDCSDFFTHHPTNGFLQVHDDLQVIGKLYVNPAYIIVGGKQLYLKTSNQGEDIYGATTLGVESDNCPGSDEDKKFTCPSDSIEECRDAYFGQPSTCYGPLDCINNDYYRTVTCKINYILTGPTDL